MSLNPNGLEYIRYIGDGVYVGTDGYQTWLYTFDGIKVTNKIALERNVWKELLAWDQEVMEDD